MPQHAFTGEADGDVTLSVQGRPIEGVWASWEGGDVEADFELIYPGGQADPEPFVGPAGASVITLDRPYRAELDGALKKWLRGRIGHEGVAANQDKTAQRTRVPGGLDTFRCVVVGVSTPTYKADGRTVRRFWVRVVPVGLPS